MESRHGLMQEGNVDVAVEHYKAASRKTRCTRASLAPGLLERTRPREAIQELEQAVAQADSDSQLHDVGTAYLQAGKEDKGVEPLLRPPIGV